MSHRALNQEQFFHGTQHELELGSHLTPEGAKEAGHRHRASSHVHFTSDRYLAALWAFPHAGGRNVHPGQPEGRVYQVEPTGSYQRDYRMPRRDQRISFATEHPVRIVRELGEDDFADYPAHWRDLKGHPHESS